jgi:hypothetical protein
VGFGIMKEGMPMGLSVAAVTDKRIKIVTKNFIIIFG